MLWLQPAEPRLLPHQNGQVRPLSRERVGETAMFTHHGVQHVAEAPEVAAALDATPPPPPRQGCRAQGATGPPSPPTGGPPAAAPTATTPGASPPPALGATGPQSPPTGEPPSPAPTSQKSLPDLSSASRETNHRFWVRRKNRCQTNLFVLITAN